MAWERYIPPNSEKAKNYTQQEILEAAQKLKDYCLMIHHDNPKYDGGYVCDYCIFAKKAVYHKYTRENGQEVSECTSKPICYLQDDYGRHEPEFWRLEKAKIEEAEPSLF